MQSSLEKTLTVRAKLILKVAKFNNDSFSSRTPESLKENETQHHKICLRNYIKEYEKAQSACFTCSETIYNDAKRNNMISSQFQLMHSKAMEMGDEAMLEEISLHYDAEKKTITCQAMSHNLCLYHYLSQDDSSPENIFDELLHPLIEDILVRGYSTTLCDLKAHLEAEYNDHFKFYTNKIKSCIIRRFGDSIQFLQPTAMNKSIIVFPAYLSESDIMNENQTVEI